MEGDRERSCVFITFFFFTKQKRNFLNSDKFQLRYAGINIQHCEVHKLEEKKIVKSRVAVRDSRKISSNDSYVCYDVFAVVYYHDMLVYIFTL